MEDSSKEIKELVQKEGKTARNLVKWTLSVTQPSQIDQTDKLRSDEVIKNTSLDNVDDNQSTNCLEFQKSTRGDKDLLDHETTLESDRNDSIHISFEESNSDISLNEAVCLVTAGEYIDSQRRTKLSVKTDDFRARYWSYLFDNLHRAVDEIYYTCEADESVIECQVWMLTVK